MTRFRMRFWVTLTFPFTAGTDAQLWQCSFEPDGLPEDGALLVAERGIGAGEEIFHLYNANSSAMLWMAYGFLEARFWRSSEQARSGQWAYSI